MRRELGLAEVKAIELEILSNVKQVCAKNHLQFFLHGGTLIGAIRHHGFIPWDDDIDISMPRTDYEKFIRINLSEKKLRILSGDNQDSYYYSFAKVSKVNTFIQNPDEKTEYGVFIDVFPIDNLPIGNFDKNIYFLKAYTYKRLLMHLNMLSHQRTYNPVKLLVRCATKLLNRRQLIDNFNRYLMNVPESNEVSTITTGAQWNISYDRKWFEKSVDVEFEGEFFPAPVGYDPLLRKYFGDYMQLPPKEEQVSHGFTYLIDR